MAVGIHFPEVNFILGAPAGYEDQVVPLPVRRDQAGRSISCWELSVEEIAELVKTRKIWLSVWAGFSHPPVFLTGKKSDVLEPSAPPDPGR